MLRFELRVSCSQSRRDNQASLHPDNVDRISDKIAWDRKLCHILTGKQGKFGYNGPMKKIDNCDHQHLPSVKEELRIHFPYSIFSALVAIGFAALFSEVFLQGNTQQVIEASSGLFHILHPTHLLFSAIAISAMFWTHEKKLWKAVLVGIFATVPVCSIGDILIPYLGGLLLHQDMHLHICIIEHPGLVIPFVLIGIMGGCLAAETVEKSTIFSHSAHVLVSCAAALFYLISFGFVDWLQHIGVIFVILLIAVLVPCIIHDIVVPVLLLENKKKVK